MTTVRMHLLLFAFLSAFLLSGTAAALGAKGDDMAGPGPGTKPDNGATEKQAGKVPAEAIAVFGVG